MDSTKVIHCVFRVLFVLDIYFAVVIAHVCFIEEHFDPETNKLRWAVQRMERCFCQRIIAAGIFKKRACYPIKAAEAEQWFIDDPLPLLNRKNWVPEILDVLLQRDECYDIRGSVSDNTSDTAINSTTSDDVLSEEESTSNYETTTSPEEGTTVEKESTTDSTAETSKVITPGEDGTEKSTAEHKTIAAIATNEESYSGNMTKLSLIGKTTEQINTWTNIKQGKTFVFVSDYAIDGNKNTDLLGSSCTHTEPGPAGSWWMVDLDISECVTRVEITNRVGCCEDRLIDAIVRVGDNATRANPTCGQPITGTQVNTGPLIVITCQVPLRGRYISINLPDNITHALTLCEVEVFSTSDC